MLLTILAIFTAVFYLFRTPRIRHWNLVACYLVCLFSAWTGLVLSPEVFPPVVLKTVGGVLVLAALVVLIFDYLLEIFERLCSTILSRWKISPPLARHLMEICRAAETLAKNKVGATMILERRNKLGGHVSGGMAFDAELKAEVLIALFQKESPCHDGAVLVSNSRITRVKAILPLSTKSPLPLGVGTRHRSAVGITEKTDAIALVVSEERGEMSVAYKGKLAKAVDQAAFVKFLKSALRGREIREA
ncbi:MAG: DNA integrity scanning protein DisA nucleotide-binding domain protein [Candidatus Omnitrophica bacterium]|nr:DNA integrity scanning protein DisA nucleotide-binding domain protein [Candidatus Omnitrophota bacterium]